MVGGKDTWGSRKGFKNRDFAFVDLILLEANTSSMLRGSLLGS